MNADHFAGAVDLDETLAFGAAEVVLKRLFRAFLADGSVQRVSALGVAVGFLGGDEAGPADDVRREGAVLDDAYRLDGDVDAAHLIAELFYLARGLGGNVAGGGEGSADREVAQLHLIAETGEPAHFCRVALLDAVALVKRGERVRGGGAVFKLERFQKLVFRVVLARLPFVRGGVGYRNAVLYLNAVFRENVNQLGAGLVLLPLGDVRHIYRNGESHSVRNDGLAVGIEYLTADRDGGLRLIRTLRCGLEVFVAVDELEVHEPYDVYDNDQAPESAQDKRF